MPGARLAMHAPSPRGQIPHAARHPRTRSRGRRTAGAGRARRAPDLPFFCPKNPGMAYTCCARANGQGEAFAAHLHDLCLGLTLICLHFSRARGHGQ